MASSGPHSQPQTLSRRRPNSSTSASPSSNTTPIRTIYRVSQPSQSEFPFWQQNWFIAVLLFMSISCFAFAFFLVLGYDVDSTSAWSSQPVSEGVEVLKICLFSLEHVSLLNCNFEVFCCRYFLLSSGDWTMIFLGRSHMGQFLS